MAIRIKRLRPRNKSNIFKKSEIIDFGNTNKTIEAKKNFQILAYFKPSYRLKKTSFDQILQSQQIIFFGLKIFGWNWFLRPPRLKNMGEIEPQRLDFGGGWRGNGLPLRFKKSFRSPKRRRRPERSGGQKILKFGLLEAQLMTLKIFKF